ncbi:hypothetical protein Bbelb_088770 [Branchiostoma belcheri]|nr:hypothetical protein Bbelb_088770 [Branchiostoma belcheri]
MSQNSQWIPDRDSGVQKAVRMRFLEGPIESSRVAVLVKIGRGRPPPWSNMEEKCPVFRHVSAPFQSFSMLKIQPGAFRGMPDVKKLCLADNLISNLEADTFVGLESLTHLFLDKNAITNISQYAFRGLPPLQVLQLSKNCLSTVPLESLLQLKAVRFVTLAANHIATIDSSILRLSHIRRFDMTNNRLKCDESLAWFICNLRAPSMKFIFHPDSLKCASPAGLHGTPLISLITGDATDGTGSMRCDETSSAGLQMTSVQPNETVPTEYYTKTPYTNNNVSVFEHTTEMEHVVLLGESPTINEDDRKIQRHVQLLTAVIVPLVLTLAVGFLLFICRRTGLACRSPTQDNPASSQEEGDHKIEPYAVVYDDSADLQAPDRTSATGEPPNARETSEGNETIQPYAVAYVDVSGKGKNGKLSPYAMTSLTDDQTSENTVQPDTASCGPSHGKIQPYAVGYPNNASQATENYFTHLQNVQSPFAQPDNRSLPTIVITEPKYERSLEQSIGEGPYEMENEKEMPNAGEMLYRSGSEHTPEDHSRQAPHILYSPAHGDCASYCSGMCVASTRLSEVAGKSRNWPNRQSDDTCMPGELGY